jgi:hypothetical protein
VDWQGEDAIDVAEGFDIPKHQNKPTAWKQLGAVKHRHPT